MPVHLGRFTTIIVASVVLSVSDSAADAQWYGGWSSGGRMAPWGWGVPRPYYPPPPAYYVQPPYYPAPSYYPPPPGYYPYWGYYGVPEYYLPSYNPATGRG